METPSNAENQSSAKSGAAGDERPGELRVATGQCEETSGVSLVIDTAGLGKGVFEYCVIDFVGTSWELLQVAGASPEGTSDYPVGFVCRLLGVPDGEAQDCLDTPSYAEGSWGFFAADGRAAQAAEWAVSGIGASWRKPSCGQADGWRFVSAGEAVSAVQPAAKPRVASCD